MSDQPLSLQQFENFDFRELPIGVYMTALDGQIVVCNTILRKMLDLPQNGQLNANIADYYAEAMIRKTAIERAIALAEQGRPIEKETLHLKVNDQDLYVEDYCRVMQDESGKVVGFVGCMVDVTHEIETRKHERELQERVKELTFDIGRILHANNTTLMMVKQTLDSVIEAFEPKSNKDASILSAEEQDVLLTDHAHILASAIERFTQSADEERRLKALPAAQWNKLAGYIGFLREFKDRIPTPELYPATLRKLANDVGQIHGSVAPGFVSREHTRELQNAAWHLERVTNLIEVLETRASVIQMDHTIHSLREFITSEAREPVERKRLSVRTLIEESAKRLAEYARSLKIDIERKEVEDVYVLANERELVRAFSNLMHNAIKYSWRRDPERARPAWVSIRTRVKDKKVYIEFENWGVPIKREEIETGKIFELGYRGEMSKDRGRLGTGIGLTDARRVAESHGGSVDLESHPALRGAYSEKQDSYYSHPFLTKVTMVLPLAKK